MLAKIDISCKFCQNRFSALELATDTRTYRHTDNFSNKFFELRVKTTYFNRKTKIFRTINNFSSQQ